MLAQLCNCYSQTDPKNKASHNANPVTIQCKSIESS